MWHKASELTLAMNSIHQAVTILDNEEDLRVLFVQQRFGAWMIFMSDHREQLGSLGDSMNHLLKITRSYWSGLFHCYQVDNLPKTNNDLEQVFGSFRHHQRRTTGRLIAPASLLIRGSSRLISAVVTRIHIFHRNRFSYCGQRKLGEINVHSWNYFEKNVFNNVVFAVTLKIIYWN